MVARARFNIEVEYTPGGMKLFSLLPPIDLPISPELPNSAPELVVLDGFDSLSFIVAVVIGTFFVFTAAYVLWLVFGPLVSVPVGILGFYAVAKSAKNTYDENK
ncbi:hypothetical protein AUG19_00985 [archaeon 13_1_20CM_2_54_9]|nr:MAG: hypothetical protein AUG19_00985 [archaeon 13_1_20CM_2_54_9]